MPINDAPVPVAQIVNVTEDVQQSITLEASDVEGSTLTFTVASGPSTIEFTIEAVNDEGPVGYPQTIALDEDAAVALTLSATDYDEDALTFSIATPPQFGSLTGTPPNLVYTPEPDFHGADAMVFLAFDGTEHSDPATVSLTIYSVEDDPVAIADQFEVYQNTERRLDVLANDTDADQDPLVVQSSGTPTHGEVVPIGDSELLYIPELNYTGTTSFDYVAVDANGRTDTAVVTLNIVEAPPGVFWIGRRRPRRHPAMRLVQRWRYIPTARFM